jgi:hypothetical protein
MIRFQRKAVLAPRLLLLGLSLAACDALLGTGRDTALLDQLRQNERVWQQERPTSYAMTITRATSAAQPPRTVRLHVAGDQLVAGTDVVTGEPLPAAELAAYPTVDDIFAIIRDALAQRAPSITLAYDADLGFPTLVDIVYDFAQTGARLAMSVAQFTAADD